MKSGTLALLTPMRGFAAIMVVVYHATLGAGCPRGYLAVDFFFMLSGFILTHVYGVSFTQRPTPAAVGHFLWLRLCRIYPVHAAITLSLVPLVGSGPGFSPFDLANNLLLTQVFLPHASFNDVSWSVSAEWYAYLLFPILAIGVSRVRRRAIPVLIAALILLWCAGVAAGAFAGDGGWLGIARMLPEFIGGMLLYRVYAAGWQTRVWASDGALLTTAAAVFLSAHLGAPNGVIVALLPALLLAAASNAGRGAIVLTAAPLRFLGEASYSIYLAQGLVLLFGQAVSASPFHTVLGVNELRVAMIGASIAVGLLVYRCIEQPCRTAMRTVPSWWREAQGRRRLTSQFHGITPAAGD